MIPKSNLYKGTTTDLLKSRFKFLLKVLILFFGVMCFLSLSIGFAGTIAHEQLAETFGRSSLPINFIGFLLTSMLFFVWFVIKEPNESSNDMGSSLNQCEVLNHSIWGMINE